MMLLFEEAVWNRTVGIGATLAGTARMDAGCEYGSLRRRDWKYSSSSVGGGLPVYVCCRISAAEAVSRIYIDSIIVSYCRPPRQQSKFTQFTKVVLSGLRELKV